MKTLKQSLYILGALCVVVAPHVFASDAGTTGAAFLTVPVHARAIAMGEAFSALANDTGSLYWNPAGLANLERKEASFLYNQYLQDVTFQHAAIGLPLENGSIGGSLTYTGYGRFEGVTVDAGNNPVASGDINANSFAGTLGGAWSFANVHAGLNLKVIQEKLADVKATTIAFDPGVMVEYPKPFFGGQLRGGLVVKNLGPGIKFIDQRDPLPREVRLGFAAANLMEKRLNVALDISKQRDIDWSIGGGAEYWLIRHIAIRAGWVENHTEGLGIRTGIGLRVGAFLFDYAYAGLGDLGLAHRYQVTWQFGNERIQLTAEEKKSLQEAKAAMDRGDYQTAFTIYDQLATKRPGMRKAHEGMKLALNAMQSQRVYMVSDQKKQMDPTMNPSMANEVADNTDLQDLLNTETTRTAEVQVMMNPSEETR